MKKNKKKILIGIGILLMLLLIGLGFYFAVFNGSKNTAKIPNEIVDAINKINNINKVFTNGALDYKNDNSAFKDSRSNTCYLYKGDNKKIIKELDDVYTEPFALISNFRKIKRGNEEVVYICKKPDKKVKSIDINKIVLLSEKKNKRAYTFGELLIEFSYIDGKWKTDLPIVIYE